MGRETCGVERTSVACGEVIFIIKGQSKKKRRKRKGLKESINLILYLFYSELKSLTLYSN
jgi:hypothetical protein